MNAHLNEVMSPLKAEDMEDYHESDLVKDILGSAEDGVAIFDQDLSMVTCNRRYIDMFGYSSEGIEGRPTLPQLMRMSLQKQGHSSENIDTTIEAALEAMRGGATQRFNFTSPDGVPLTVVRKRTQTGRIVERVMADETAEKTMPMGPGSIETLAMTAHNRMTHALEVMAEGFALYDNEDRLVIYNRKYVELNPHIADLIMPGAKFEDMLRKGVERGAFNLFGQSKEDFIRWRVDQHQNPEKPYELQMHDGLWVLVNEKVTSDGGIVGTRSDITELKKREFEVQRISKELFAKNAHFDTALNNMIQGLCMFDSDQKLIVFNNQYLEMYGFSSDIVKPGITIREIMEYSISLGNYTQEQAEKALAERGDHDKLRERTTIKQRLKDGRVIAVMNQPMEGGGSIATYQDITLLERHEEKLIAYTKKLERSNSELQDFAYVASHDLQEPLRKIEAFGDRLARKYSETLPDDGKMFIDRMQNAASRMRQLINDLLSYSRVTTNAKPFNNVDLNEILEGVLSDLQMRIEDHGGTIESNDLPTLQADPTQMRQLLQNFLSNALKFKKPDVSPVIKVTGEVIKEPGTSKEICRITIADNGIGFDNQFKDQIFTIFQRLHGRMEYEGTGIGLATCRKIIDRHNGAIEADGRPDEGATFIIDLPLRQASEGVE